MSESYDPNSQDSMLSRIIARLDNQDTESRVWRGDIMAILSEIRTETKKTNGRVTNLEQWRETLKANRTLLLSLIGGATTVGAGAATLIMWLIERFSH